MSTRKGRNCEHYPLSRYRHTKKYERMIELNTHALQVTADHPRHLNFCGAGNVYSWSWAQNLWSHWGVGWGQSRWMRTTCTQVRFRVNRSTTWSWKWIRIDEISWFGTRCRPLIRFLFWTSTIQFVFCLSHQLSGDISSRIFLILLQGHLCEVSDMPNFGALKRDKLLSRSVSIEEY